MKIEKNAELQKQYYKGTWVSREGNGDPIILIHGVGLDHHMWNLQVSALKKSFRVIAYDIIGHGKSIQPPGQRFLNDFVEQLHQLMENLK